MQFQISSSAALLSAALFATKATAQPLGGSIGLPEFINPGSTQAFVAQFFDSINLNGDMCVGDAIETFPGYKNKGGCYDLEREYSCVHVALNPESADSTCRYWFETQGCGDGEIVRTGVAASGLGTDIELDATIKAFHWRCEDAEL